MNGPSHCSQVRALRRSAFSRRSLVACRWPQIVLQVTVTGLYAVNVPPQPAHARGEPESLMCCHRAASFTACSSLAHSAHRFGGRPRPAGFVRGAPQPQKINAPDVGTTTAETVAAQGPLNSLIVV